MNQTELIKEFVENKATSGEAGEAKIIGDQFIHFSTPIIERYNGKFILNTSNYSDITRFLVRKIRSIIPEDKIIEVNKITMNHSGSLKEFLK